MLINVWADIMYITVIYEKCGEGAFIRGGAFIRDNMVRESRALALFLYNCTARILEHLPQCLHAHKCCVGLIHLLHGCQYFDTNI